MEKRKMKKVLALRFTDSEYDELDSLIQMVRRSIGIKVSKAWIVKTMMKMGEERFISKYGEDPLLYLDAIAGS